jgi:hypothetical protein
MDILFPIIFITVVVFVIIALRLTDKISKKQQYFYTIVTLLLPIPYYYFVIKTLPGTLGYSIFFLFLSLILLVGWFRDK